MTAKNVKPGAVAAAHGLREGEKLNSSPSNTLPTECAQDPVLVLLYDRCCVLVARVAAGQLPFLDAVDMAWSASEFSGTVDRVGPDRVQAILARAFMVRR
jgi:hypothetical protein